MTITTNGAVTGVIQADQAAWLASSVSGAGLQGDGIAAPAGTPTSAVGSAGVLTGGYYYAVTYVTAAGETAPWPGTATVVNPLAQQVNLTAIPVGPAGVTARRIYRTPATPTDPKDYRFLVEIADNVTTTYTDNTADGSLGNPVSWAATNRGVMTDGVETLISATDQSTGIGYQAFNANTGYASVAIGYQALSANTTGRRNTAVGTYALPALTTGYQNAAYGTHAGNGLTTGIQNTLLGYAAGFNLTTHGGNTFVGESSGTFAGLSGASANNTGVGRDALKGTTGLGQHNVGVGFFAARDINTADQVVAIGPWAGRYANASRQLFIDNSDRTNITNAQNIGLIYGKGESTAIAQVLHLNAPTRIGPPSVTVATLPAAAAGYTGFRAFVTDANATTFASIVAGGGANGVPVYCDGTNWRIG